MREFFEHEGAFNETVKSQVFAAVEREVFERVSRQLSGFVRVRLGEPEMTSGHIRLALDDLPDVPE